MTDPDRPEDEMDAGVKAVIDRCYNAFISERRIRPADVSFRAAEAKTDYLSNVPGELYRLMRDDIASVWSLLESPIEQVAIFHLASENYGREDWPIYAKVAKRRGLYDHKNYPVQLIPQVEFGRYRVDFLMDLGGRGLVGLECDGEEFHQDRQKDWARDKELRDKHGVIVFRLPGKDIWRDNTSTQNLWVGMIRHYLKWGALP